MDIVVCIKQVPDTTEVKIDPKTNTLVRQGVPSIVNPFDKNAIEAGLRLKEKYGGKVTVVSMGPPQANDALKECLAIGADEAVLVSDRAFGGADTLATSYTLASTIRTLGHFDVILCGKQAIDGDTAQVGPGVAKRLGMNLLTYVSRIVELDLDGQRLKVERRAEGGVQLLDTTLPSLVTMLEGTNEMRFASLDDMLRAGRFQVRKWNKDDAGIEDVSKIGLKGSPTIVSKVFGPTPRTEKADMQVVADSNPQDVTLNLLQKIFTTHPQIEAELVERLSA